MNELEKHIPQLFNDDSQIIEGRRLKIATSEHAEVSMFHWHIGKRKKEDVWYKKRTGYGKEIVKHFAEKLTERFGKAWSDRQLLDCLRAAYTFTENEIVCAVRTQLSWTHLRSFMFIDDVLKRSF